jgi:BirA family biotin operon repressor/biotin-[acetyl-CoA-carboxylase] ligase
MSNKNKNIGVVSESNNLNPKDIKIDLNTKIIGQEIFYFKTIPSTNDYARILIKKDVKEGTIVLADEQTSGRGRKSRVWSSPKGGLWFSIILYPSFSPKDAMMLTMAASISVTQAIQEITDLKPVIKWPNDILIDEKKVCGVLTELETKNDKIIYSIIGIGINVNNQLNKDLSKNATTLLEKYGSMISKNGLFSCILENFDNNYLKLMDNDFSSIREKWLFMSKIVGREVIIREDDRTIQGVVSGVDDNGQLILKNNKEIKHISSGDLEYL